MKYAYFLASFHLALGGLILLLSLVLLRENPRHRLNRLLALLLFFAGLGATIGSSDFLMPQIDPKASRERVDLVVQFSYLWEFFFPTLLLFVLSFPTRHAVLQIRGLAFFLFVPHLAHFVLGAMHALTGDSFGIPSGPDAASVWTLPRVVVPVIYRLHRSLFVFVNLAFVTASIMMIGQRIREITRPRVREQLAAIGWGMGAGGLLYFLSAMAPKGPDALSSAFRQTLLLLSLLLASGSIAYSLVRYRFLDASLLARRTILYAVSTALVVGLYVLIIGQIERLLQRAAGFETQIFQGLVFVLALILYQPLLSKMEEMLENLLLRDHTDHRTALRALGEGLATSLDPGELSRIVVTGLGNTLLTDRVALVRYALDGDERPSVAAAEGFGAPDEILTALPGAGEIVGLDAMARLEVGSTSLLMLPLRHRGQPLGAILLGPKVTGGRYSREDETLLGAVASQVSVALKTAELHEAAVRRAGLARDIENARRIQESFLPSHFPARQGIDVFGHHVPSREVGGDYYDALELGDRSVFLAVADVSGKGMPAALLATMLQASLRTQVATELSPASITKRLNHLVCSGTTSGQFATLFLARYDVEDRRLTYANAGHSFPILVKRPGPISLLDHSDLVLGCLPDIDYEERTLDLDPGDHLVLYTDGITEASMRGVDDDMLGEDGLIAILRDMDYAQPASAFVHDLRHRFEAVTDHEHEADDRTLLVLKVTPPETVGFVKPVWHDLLRGPGA